MDPCEHIILKIYQTQLAYAGKHFRPICVVIVLYHTRSAVTMVVGRTASSSCMHVSG